MKKEPSKAIERSFNTNSTEPYFYMAFVLKGSEKQYLNLLKYVNNRNGAQIIYQCKSLTYLRVSREDHSQIRSIAPETVRLEAEEAK